MKRKLKKSAKIAIGAAAAIAVVGGAYFGWSLLNRQSMASLAIQADQKLLTVEAGTGEVDYGTVFQAESPYDVSGSVDTKKTGSYPVTVTVHGKDLFGNPKDKEYSYSFTVQDTTAPELTLGGSRLFIISGDSFDPLSNVAEAYDLLDGKIAAHSGKITRTDSEDLTVLGEHTITLKVTDDNGNSAEKSYVLAVGKKEDDKDPYVIRINRAENTVTVYMMDENGEYALPATAMVCSVGSATPAGTFHIGNKSEWRSLSGNVFGQYVTELSGDVLFQSVPYSAQEKNSLEYEEYNKLGTAVGTGGIRLSVKDAKWIYDACVNGTLVEIYDDEGNPGPLGKPELIQITSGDERSGWDPTDPDPENPWNTKHQAD